MKSRQAFVLYSTVSLAIVIYFTIGLFAASLPQGGDALTWTLTQRFEAKNGWMASAWVSVSWPGGPSQVSIMNLILTSLYSVFPSSAVSNVAVVFLFFLSGV